MSKQKPAHWKQPISITLSPDIIETLRNLAEVREVSVSSLLNELLEEMQPTLDSVTQNLTYLKTATAEQKEALRSRFAELGEQVDAAYTDLANKMGDI